MAPPRGDGVRAALLPAGGDPFLLAYWLRHYRTWADQVDELRLAVCGQDDPAIRSYLASLAGPGIVLTFHPRTDHGALLGQLIAETPADLVMLCEDDAFVRSPAAVGEMFRQIETGATDIVASPRGSASTEFYDTVIERYGNLTAAETGETGPFFWPCFLFARKADLLRTDGHFGAWPEGTPIPLADFSPPGPQAVDTFGWASVQLRATGLRVSVVPQYRAQKTTWPGAPWFHVGSLSSGYGGSFLGDYPADLLARHFAAIRNDLYDWHKRMSWWQRVWERWDGGLPEHHDAYGQAIRDYMTGTGMAQGAVDEWRRLFDELVTWSE